MKSHSYYVYILKCSDNSYYTGITSDLELRFQQHQEGINPSSYTYSRRPVELMFYQEFQYIDKAIAFEKQVKGWSRKKKKAIINDHWDKLPMLAMNKRNREKDWE